MSKRDDESQERNMVRERVALAMSNAKDVSGDEREYVAEVMQGAPTWDELPADVIELVEAWEDRAGFGG